MNENSYWKCRCGLHPEHHPYCAKCLETKESAPLASADDVEALQKEAGVWRSESADQEARREASWERSDTDGFLSQWASGLSAQKARMQVEVTLDGGYDWFPALFDLEGNLVRAKMVSTRYGTAWALHDENGEFTGKFVSAFPKRKSTMKKKGYQEGWVLLPAKADIRGSGRGLSGNAWACVVPVVGGKSPYTYYETEADSFPPFVEDKHE